MKIENQVCTLEQAKLFAGFKVGEDYFPLYVWVPEFPIFNDTVRLCTFNEFESRLKNSILSDDARALVGFYPAFTIPELSTIIGKGTKAAEHHWQWLIDCVNSGLSGTVAYNTVALAGFVLTQLEIGALTPEEVNNRLNS